MDLDVLLTLIQWLVPYGVAGLFAGLTISMLVWLFLPGYLSRKGANLADKEDVRKITAEIEKARAPFAIELERHKTENQLRLAAVDRRMQAHQEAYTLWWELMGNVHRDGNSSTVIKCQEWWSRNCLYLEARPREAFSRAYKSASNHGHLLTAREDVEVIKENWSQIIGAGNIILDAVQLPGLTSTEKEQVDQLQKAAIGDAR